MKLAEALQERADLNKKIQDLSDRLNQNCMVQEGEIPNEKPEKLLTELNASIKQLQKLITDINLTNCKTIVDGKSLTEIIAEKDCEAIRLAAYRKVADRASTTTYRARGTEIKIVTTISVAQLQKTADSIAKRIRLLDNTLQATNWSVELIDS